MSFRRRVNCNICNKSFKDKYALNFHTRVHTGERPFKCSECSKSFQQPGHLKEHMVLHTQKSEFKCEICRKYFATNGSLKKHKAVHSNERRFKCSICDKSFKRNAHLQSHQKIHDQERVRPLNCDKCNKTFDRESCLKIHQSVHTGLKEHTCFQCGNKFSSKVILSNHVKHVHQNPVKTECKICGVKVFNLKRHLEMHETERHFKCEMCDRAFKHLRNLHAHFKSHTRETPEVCFVCGKRFITKNALNMHSLVHFDWIEECLFCSKRVKSRYMEYHVRLHTDEKPYWCLRCSKEFSTGNLRLKHMKVKHENCIQ